MGHFPRVIRIAFQQRWTVVGIVATSLIIAGLWGSNIATLYPMVEIVFKDSSLPEHIDSVIDRSKTRVAEIDQAIALLQSQSTNDTDKRRALDRRIQYQRSQRERAQAQADWYLWMKPTIDRYAPKNPFQTLTMIVVLLLVGTFVKLLALSVNIMLVQRLSQLTASQLRELFFRRSLHLDMEHFSANGSADLTARLTNDINQAAVGVKVLVGKLIREPLKMAVCFCGAAFVCWRLLL
ncbi:MAG: ABC transporter transmembrane domain-containing protein, partial [Planctomycetota bacterium]